MVINILGNRRGRRFLAGVLTSLSPLLESFFRSLVPLTLPLSQVLELLLRRCTEACPHMCLCWVLSGLHRKSARQASQWHHGAKVIIIVIRKFDEQHRFRPTRTSAARSTARSTGIRLGAAAIIPQRVSTRISTAPLQLIASGVLSLLCDS